MAKILKDFSGKVIFAGGGTGGHLYPGIALAEELTSRGFNRFLFLVSNRQIDKDILEKCGYSFVSQKVSAFMGLGILAKMKSVLSIAISSLSAMKYINDGDVVILTGGFAAAPACIAARIKGAEIYLHEQNSVMGIVNRFCSKISKKIFLSFKEMKNFDVSLKNVYVVGNPVRKNFYRIERNDKKEECKNILIMGGSQGSKILNENIVAVSHRLLDTGFKIVHQVGGKLYNETIESYGSLIDEYKDKLIVIDYIDDVVSAMKQADLIISRSGAGALFEIRAAKLPAIFIPFAKAAENHQYYNALELVNNKASELILEDDLSEDILFEAVNNMRRNIDKYRDNMNALKMLESSKLILDEVFCE